MLTLLFYIFISVVSIQLGYYIFVFSKFSFENSSQNSTQNEEPISIINMIEEGIKRTDGKYIKIVDRTKAIKHALTIGKKDDLIILAGKGHETYVEINHVRTHYDEREIVSELLKEIL